ncbi:hypothetical protein [Prosthecobacter sp.]
MTLLFLMAARLCFLQLEQFVVDEWTSVAAVAFISLSLAISHHVHMITRR